MKALIALILFALAGAAIAKSSAPDAAAAKASAAAPSPAAPPAEALAVTQAAASDSVGNTRNYEEAPKPVSAPAQAAEDETEAKPAVLDLKQAETQLLVKISDAVKKDEAAVLFNLEDLAAVDKKGNGVAEVKAEELYMELATRLQAGDKDAKASIAAAIAKGDLRARGAKDLAFEDKMANSFIKRLDNGDKGAKAEIEKLANKGNRRAREFLGMDKPAPAEAPKLSGTAK